MGENYRTRVHRTLETPPVFTFEIPEGGYEAPPIVRTGWNSSVLFARDSEDIPRVVFTVSKDSPYRKAHGRFIQPLVDWSLNGGTVNTDGVSFLPMSGANEGLFFTPETGDAKSGIAASCVDKFGLTILIR